MKPRSAIKTDLFAFDHHRKKIDTLGDPLAEIESYIDFVALARGQGCDGVHVEKAGELADVLARALAHPRPIVVEVEVA